MAKDCVDHKIIRVLLVHSLSAFCHKNGLILGEQSCNEKSNEITAIPLLLENLDIKGATISIDAGGCYKQIAQKIIDKKANYVLGLKRNNPKLLDEVKGLINQIGHNNSNCLSDEFEKKNGRVTRRRYFGFDISNLSQSIHWSEIKSVIAVESIASKANNNTDKNVVSTWRYYISNHNYSNLKLPSYIRNHWGIENKLHWVLDVQMNEDDDKKIEKKSVRSFAILKRTAINIINTKKLFL